MFLEYFTVTLTLGTLVVVGIAALIIREPSRLVRFLGRLGVWGMLVFGVLFGLFAAGYAFEDLPLGSAILTVATWVVPVVLFGWLVLRLPGAARFIALGLWLVALVPMFADALWPQEWREFMDRVGPISALSVMAVAMVLAVWGFREPRLAGMLMLGLGLASVVSEVLAGGYHGGTSTEVATAPVLVAGALIAISGLLYRPERVG